jgi:hypothetical protein
MKSQKKDNTMDVSRFIEDPTRIVTISKPKIFRTKSPARMIQEQAMADIVRKKTEILLSLLDEEGQKILDKNRLEAMAEIAGVRMTGIQENTDTAVRVDNALLTISTMASRNMQDLVSNAQGCVKIVAAVTNENLTGVSMSVEENPNIVDADFEINEQEQA